MTPLERARFKVATQLAEHGAGAYLIPGYLRGEMDDSEAIRTALVEISVVPVGGASEPLERAARAVENALGAVFDDVGAGSDGAAWWSRKAARAVLAAIREPSEGMEQAAMKAGDDYYRGDPIGWKEVPVMWQAMIDAALAEGE